MVSIDTFLCCLLPLDLFFVQSLLSVTVFVPLNFLLGEDTSQNIPTVTGGQHSKIANGSSLIEISCTASQGRFLKVGYQDGIIQINPTKWGKILAYKNLIFCSKVFKIYGLLLLYNYYITITNLVPLFSS